MMNFQAALVQTLYAAAAAMMTLISVAETSLAQIQPLKILQSEKIS